MTLADIKIFQKHTDKTQNYKRELNLSNAVHTVKYIADGVLKENEPSLIVIERDIRIQDIISTGIIMNSEISPQLLVNIFEPKTPLHDGAVVISENKIAAAACMLPLSDNKDIASDKYEELKNKIKGLSS